MKNRLKIPFPEFVFRAGIEVINAGQRQDAINKMEAFINAVEAQRDKQLTGEQTDSLIALAQEILASL